MEKPHILEKKYLTGSTLKWIAIITMFIDHIGAFLIGPYLLENGIFPGLNFGGAAGLEGSHFYMLFQMNLVFRLIGRLAFPIFAFLIVEGFIHTSNFKKYIFQMGIFALISEIPSDLVKSGVILEFTYQNIFFTLLTGLLCIRVFDLFHEKNNMKWLVPIVAMVVSSFLKFDYGAMGVLVIFIFYYFHDDFQSRNLFNGVVLLQQLTGVLALIPIQLYNGKRGKQNKFFFYVFYPAHLFLLFLVKEYCLTEFFI